VPTVPVGRVDGEILHVPGVSASAVCAVPCDMAAHNNSAIATAVRPDDICR